MVLENENEGVLGCVFCLDTAGFLMQNGLVLPALARGFFDKPRCTVQKNVGVSGGLFFARNGKKKAVIRLAAVLTLMTASGFTVRLQGLGGHGTWRQPVF